MSVIPPNVASVVSAIGVFNPINAESDDTLDLTEDMMVDPDDIMSTPDEPGAIAGVMAIIGLTIIATIIVGALLAVGHLL